MAWMQRSTINSELSSHIVMEANAGGCFLFEMMLLRNPFVFDRIP